MYVCAVIVREGCAGGERLCAVQRGGENYNGGVDAGSAGSAVRDRQDFELWVCQRSSTTADALSGTTLTESITTLKYWSGKSYL